jgi:hypothetical protein
MNTPKWIGRFIRRTLYLVCVAHPHAGIMTMAEALEHQATVHNERRQA